MSDKDEALLRRWPDGEPVAWMDAHGNIDRGLDAILNPEGWKPLYTYAAFRPLFALEAKNAELRAANKRAMFAMRDMEAALETERMRLVACGVVALADTPESAASARQMHDDYRSASLTDVIRSVDECIALRAALEQARVVLSELVALKDMESRLQELHEMGHGTDYENYYRRKPAAWLNARAALRAIEEVRK